MAKPTSTSDEILGCAQELIIAGGYNGFSYADIATAVNIRKASIHHYFPSKVDLVRTLVRRYREAGAEGMAKLEREVANPLDQLRFYIRYWQACIADASAAICLCALLASELPVLPKEVALEVRAHFRALSAWIESVLKRGASDGCLQLIGTPKDEAEAFMATVHGAMISARACDNPRIFGVVTSPLLERLMPTATRKGSSRRAK